MNNAELSVVQQQDNVSSCVLDPLSVIIKLAILSNKPVGTKLLIKDNVIYFQEPGPFQSLCRIIYNSTKNDIQYLYNPINIACVHFLSQPTNTLSPEKLTRIKKLFQAAQQGLQMLMKTYSSSYIIVIALNYYYILLSNHLEQTYNSTMFISDQMSTHYTLPLCTMLNSKWNEDQIRAVLGLINYLSKPTTTDEGTPNIKLLDTFMENIDNNTKTVLLSQL